MLAKLTRTDKSTWDMMQRDNDFRDLRKSIDPNQTELFRRGFEAYISGDFGKAEDVFS